MRQVDIHIQDQLVRKLHHVAQEPQRHDAPVDLAADGQDVDGVVGVVLDVCCIAVLVEELPGVVDVADAGGGEDVVEAVDAGLAALFFLFGGRHCPEIDTGR